MVPWFPGHRSQEMLDVGAKCTSSVTLQDPHEVQSKVYGVTTQETHVHGTVLWPT